MAALADPRSPTMAKQQILMDLSSEAEDAWRRKDYERLLQLLEKDSPFPVGFSIEEMVAEQSIREQLKRFVEGRGRLHGFIRDGDLDSIREFIRNNKSSVYYSTDNVSALFRAIECDKREICSYLSSIRPNFRIPEMVIKESNWSQEKSHILKLVHATRFSEDQNREEWHAIINMYFELDKFDEIRWLMKTIEHENFELSFAIKSESVTIMDAYGEPEDAFGYTEKNGRILIAGKGITTVEGYKKVYRIFAHELCHLAMHFMYRNSFKPYHPHDEERKSTFSVNCEEIHKKYEAMDKLIQKVFRRYDECEWESELIVRVPEVLAVYGKVKANQIFSEQIPKVYEYYKEYIFKDSAEFSKLKFYSPELLNLGKISDDHLAVRRSEMCISPFVRTENYEDYLIPIKVGSRNFSLLPTSNPKLAALHVFHAFKGIYPLHADRRVLAFHLEYYHVDGNNDVICGAFEDSFLQKLILVLPDSKDENGKITDDIFFSSNEEKEVIVVVSEALCKRHPEWNVKKQLEYHWNDLSVDYQDKLFEKRIVYQGEEISPWSVLKDVVKPRVFTPDVLWYFMSKTDIRIGEGFSSDWNERELYVERIFVRSEYKKENFRSEKSHLHYLFVTGVSEKDLQTITSMKGGLQTIESADEIQEENYIFLPKLKNAHANLFRKLFCKIKEKQNSISWVNYENEKFLLRDSLGVRDDIKNYFVEDVFNEEKILRETQGMNVILVADEPGTGKSTSINCLMEKMKRRYPEKLICRVRFSEHLKEFSASPSLPSLHKFLQRVYKMSNPLEKMAFKEFIGIHQRIVVFFDGFDEMSKELQSKAKKTLQLFRKETPIQMWIFTRKHERLTLDEEMNTVAFSLRQFSLDDQRMYLNKFWVNRLLSLHNEKEDLGNKFQEIVKNLETYSLQCEGLYKSMKELVNLIEKENQEKFIKKIKELDFSDYSILVINSVKDSILKGKFMVPLWLWMIANIIIDSNYKIPDQSNRFTFYNNFLVEKVNSYLRDKCGIQCQPQKQQWIYNIVREFIFEKLWNFFVRVMRSELYDDSSMKDDLKTDSLKEKDLEELVDVGLLRKEGEHYHFFHMTFKEFFFSQMIVKEIESEKLRSVKAKFLSDVLLKESYREVRLFLDDFLEKDESQSFVFPKSLLHGFNLIETYSEFCTIINDGTAYRIWRRIFQDWEIHTKQSVYEDSISQFLNFYPFNGSKWLPNHVMDVLNSTFTDRMLFIMFDLRVDVSHKFLFRYFSRIESNDLTAMMSIFEKILNYKKSDLKSGISSSDVSLENSEVTLKILEEEYKDEHDLFYFANKSKINIYLVSAISNNSDAFIEILRFASKLMKREDISKFLPKTREDGNSVLHLMTKNRKGRVLEDLREIQSIIGNGQLNNLLTMQNEKGKTMFHYLMEYSEDSSDVSAVLEFVEGVMEGESFMQFLLQKENEGIFLISNENLFKFKFIERYFNVEGFRDMLMENKEHVEKSIRESDCALEDILYLEEVFGKELFHMILLSKDEDGNTRLHLLMERGRDELFVSDLKVLKSILDSQALEDFLYSQNTSGFTFLHKWADLGSQDINILRELHSILLPHAFEHLLNNRNKFGQTFIIYYESSLSNLLILDEFLGKEKFIELVTSKDNKGMTRLYCNYYIKNWKLLVKDLKFYSELLEESSLKDFLLTTNEKGKTMLHYMMEFSEDSNDFSAVLEFVEGVMGRKSLMQFLFQKDNEGIFLISNANLFKMKFIVRYFNEEGFRDMLMENKEHIEESIRESDYALEDILYLEEVFGKELFHKILLSKDEDGWTRLHWLMYRVRDELFVSDLKVLKSIVDSQALEDFLCSQDTSGFTFLHRWGQFGSQDINILRELHSILLPHAFEHLLNIRTISGQTFIIHYSTFLSNLLILEEFLGKKKFIELMTAKNNNGTTRLYFDYYIDNWKLLFKDLKFYSELLEESSLRDFLLTKDKDGKTFCVLHNLNEYSRELKSILSPLLFLELQKTF